jgi:hypothetical protein
MVLLGNVFSAIKLSTRIIIVPLLIHDVLMDMAEEAEGKEVEEVGELTQYNIWKLCFKFVICGNYVLIFLYVETMF